MWQLGILLFQLLKFNIPFSGNDENELINNIQNTDVIKLLSDIPSSHQVFKDLIPKMLNLDPI